MERPIERYRARCVAFEAERDAAARASRRIANARLAMFIALVLAAAFMERSESALPVVSTAAAAIAFVALVIAHTRISARFRWADAMLRVNRQGVARIRRDWSALPLRAAPHDIAGHPYAADLDLFGSGSLAQLFGPASPQGAARISDWLLQPADPATVRDRQTAARELAPMEDLRDSVAVRAEQVHLGADAMHSFTAWLQSPGFLQQRAALVAAARVLPLLSIVFMYLDAAAIVSRPWWVLSIIASLLLLTATMRNVRATFRRAFESERMFDGVPELLATVLDARFETAQLCALQERIAAHGRADHAIRQLRSLSHLSHTSQSMLGGIINLVLLWDIHVLWALERWQRRFAAQAPGWFDALAEIEALSAIATLAHDEPGWCFPEVDGAAERITATQLGHPLLRRDIRVDNDIEIGPPGTFLLLTGSNMSGKSTLMRAVGCNVVLALAGAPVCTTSFVTPRLAVRTSIRKEDSIVEGVSLFMSELQKTKRIIDDADAAGADARVLYLLDELLQGTNTAERRTASQKIIARLIRSGAIGIVSTHDLTLIEGSGLEQRAALRHFSETITADTMSFDYKLRPGLATSSNALALLRIVGIGDPVVDEPARDRDR